MKRHWVWRPKPPRPPLLLGCLDFKMLGQPCTCEKVQTERGPLGGFVSELGTVGEGTSRKGVGGSWEE